VGVIFGRSPPLKNFLGLYPYRERKLGMGVVYQGLGGAKPPHDKKVVQENSAAKTFVPNNNATS